MGRPTALPAVHLDCRLPRRLALGALCVLLACSETGTGPEENANPRSTPENPSDGYVTVAPGVHLLYLDFGGEGDAVLLLAGLGNTANVFRDLAPLLTDHYHVLALTRRGFGRSSQPSIGYDPATLAHDIVAEIARSGRGRDAGRRRGRHRSVPAGMRRRGAPRRRRRGGEWSGRRRRGGVP